MSESKGMTTQPEIEDLLAKLDAVQGCITKGLGRAAEGDADGAHNALLAADSILGMAVESYRSATAEGGSEPV